MIVVTELPNMMVLDKSGLKITFKLERPPDIPDLLVINMLAQNFGSTILTDFLFQAAVPRVRDTYALAITFTITCHIPNYMDLSYISRLQTFQLQMLSPSSTVIPPSGQVTQVLRVTNMNRVSIQYVISTQNKLFGLSSLRFLFLFSRRPR